MGVAEDIAEQYPFLSFLAGDPEIGPLLHQAVDPATEMSEGRFMAKFMNTNWFRSRTEEGRQNDILFNTDPATYWSNNYEYQAEISALADQFGRRLTNDEALYIATAGLNMGIAPGSAMMRHWLTGLIRPEEAMQGKGEAGAAKNEVENLLKGQWFENVDYNWLARSGIDIVAGQDSLESINARAASHAWHWYPHLRKQIEEGQTLADIFNPYRQVIADELELGSVEDVRMHGGLYDLLQWRDPKSGEVRLPTMSEVRTLARSQPQWWQTAGGKQADAQGTKTLLKIFGEVA